MPVEESILTWNVPNWVSVVLMGATGFTVIGIFVKLYQRGRAAQNGNG